MLHLGALAVDRGAQQTDTDESFLIEHVSGDALPANRFESRIRPDSDV
jgi:hypothetical protein